MKNVISVDLAGRHRWEYVLEPDAYPGDPLMVAVVGELDRLKAEIARLKEENARLDKAIELASQT